MNYRGITIMSLFLLIGIIALVYTIKTQQWEYVKEILTKFIPYENGGLP